MTPHAASPMQAEVHRACRRESSSQGDSALAPHARSDLDAEEGDRSVCSSAASTAGAGGAASALLLPPPPGLRRRHAAAERDGADSCCSGAPPFLFSPFPAFLMGCKVESDL